MAKHIQRRLLLAQSNVQWSWAGGIKICPCQTFALKIGRIIGALGFFSYCLESKKSFKSKCWQKEPASLNCNPDKVCLSPSPQLLQQSVELLINLRAVPSPLRAQQDPCKGQGMRWSEADADLDLHSRKDVPEGARFPLRSYRVTLTLLPSNMDVSACISHPYDTALFIPSSQHRAEVHMEIRSVCQCSCLCLWWVLILMWTTDHWLNALPYL